MNVNLVQNNRILFEFAPTGNVRIKHEVNSYSLKHLELFTPSSTMVNLQSAIIWLLLIYQVFSILWFVRANGLKFFGYAWNYIDLLIVAFWVIHNVARFRVISNVASIESMNLNASRVGHPELFMPFSRAVESPLKFSKTMTAVLVLVMWMKTLKYLTVFKGYRTLIRVMERALAQLISFSLVILVIFFAFAVGFYVAFSSTDERFTSLWGSFLILFFYLIGGFELELSTWFGPGKDTIRPLVFFCYLLLTYFILVNVFMAIVLDAFTLVVVIRRTESTIRKKQANFSSNNNSNNVNLSEIDDRNPLLTFLYTYYHYLRKIDLVGEEEEKPEDKEF